MIPLSKPTIGEEEIEAVTEVLKSGILSLGPKIDEFEEKFSELIGSKYSIEVNSGTSGLHLALKSLGIKLGDQVITTPFSFVASANCALFEGAKPVFVDVEEDTFNINLALIKEKIRDKLISKLNNLGIRSKTYFVVDDVKYHMPAHIEKSNTDLKNAKKPLKRINRMSGDIS